MNSALRAHIRMLESTPKERITTHQSKHTAPLAQGRKYTNGMIPEDLITEYLQLKRSGMKDTPISEHMHIGLNTLRRIKTIVENRANGSNIPVGSLHDKDLAPSGQSSLPRIPRIQDL